MKKIKELYKAWRNGEEIEMELQLEFRHLVLIGFIVLMAIITVVRLLW